MTRIKQSENIHPGYIVAAKCHHQAAGCSRIRVPRMYMVSDNREGVGCREYLLTRYVNKLGVAMSSILAVRPSQSAGANSSPATRAPGEGRAFELSEACREGRKQEEKMIIEWCQKAGGLACPESWT